MSFTGLWIVCLVALAAPLAATAAGRLRVPSVVLEVVAGILIGPAVLGWVHVDRTISVVSDIGLAMLLFMAGREIDYSRLRGPTVELAALGMAVSLVFALAIGFGLRLQHLVATPVFVAVVLSATGLGTLTPIFEDAPEVSGVFYRLVSTAATFGEFTPILLLTLLFSRQATGIGTRLLLLAAFGGLALAIGLALVGVRESARVRALLTRLQDTTAQIRVRIAVVLFVAFAALAGVLGLEAVLGAFVAGAILKLVDRDAQMAHPQTSIKLQALGFGFLIPVFFVASGLSFDLHSLLTSASTLALVPIFLASQLVIRGVPAVLFARPLEHDWGRVAAAGLFSATSISTPVFASMIGVELGTITGGIGAALVASGLLSTLLFPALALSLLSRATRIRPLSGDLPPAGSAEGVGHG
jgi:Kef-type K+ transport system membrane component KefB